MRVGLAAGYNKDGLCYYYGFDYIVVGTVTRHPRSGNPVPNVIPVEGGLLNWVGMTNPGVDRLADNLQAAGRGWEAWGSIAGETVEDVVYCYKRLAPNVEKVELNISSPNAAGLQRDPGALSELLAELGPVVVKMPLADDAYDLAAVCDRAGVDELTVANSLQTIYGGLSGPIIRQRSQRMLERMRVLFPHMRLHACGGITTPDDLDLVEQTGATTAQIHTAYRLGAGPELATEV